MIESIGAIFLDGVQFTTDPETYERQWLKRLTKVATIGGNTILDFGRKAQDITLRLESGRGGQYMAREVFDALDTRAGALGVGYPFVDWNGTEATVVIAAFDGDEALPGLFYYSLTLYVRTLTKLRGVAYGGS
jgi:hypothetical protein